MCFGIDFVKTDLVRINLFRTSLSRTNSFIKSYPNIDLIKVNFVFTMYPESFVEETVVLVFTMTNFEFNSCIGLVRLAFMFVDLFKLLIDSLIAIITVFTMDLVNCLTFINYIGQIFSSIVKRSEQRY